MPIESASIHKEGAAGATDLQVRAVTATALFDGHDASINLIRRLLQEAGVEVVHLGHDRSVREIVQAAIQEDVHLVAVSSYQGGHNEFFPYLRRELDAAGAPDIKIFGGGGGVILPSEVRSLEASGVEKIFTPEDGRRLGPGGMVEAMLSKCRPHRLPECPRLEHPRELARALTALEYGAFDVGAFDAGKKSSACVVGLTGPGGAGKSSLLDELLLRFRRDSPALRIAVLCIDPSKRRSGGALLGDRLRMNSVADGAVFLRSFATRGGGAEMSPAVGGAIDVLSRAGYAIVFVETAGIGQGASAVLDVAPTTIYVMTPEFGAPTQLEKIDMLDFADLVAVNKLDRRGGQDAVDQVVRQLRRSGFENAAERVFGTSAGQFDDPGVESLYRALVALVARRGGESPGLDPSIFQGRPLPDRVRLRIVPADREAYLAEAARTVRTYHDQTERDAGIVRRLDGARTTLQSLRAARASEESIAAVQSVIIDVAEAELSSSARELLRGWDTTVERYTADELVYRVRGSDIRAPLLKRSPSGLPLRRVALPPYRDRAEVLRFLRRENLPGHFPFASGVFPLRRDDENPTRQFAGEGPPERTNRRFHLLCKDQSAIRLSTAFDSVTLYGRDPDERPDIFGKVGESGVSIATLDDMRRLFEGFDLCAPSTSVSMTINGPAPAILAMFFNAAIDQQLESFRQSEGREANTKEAAEIRDRTLRTLRGTVQADILKEDQAQNTCIFSTAFALRMMGDVQEYFIERGVRNFYSVSISGYHIAEAGANPVTQLAFTLANGFTYVEYYLSRGMDIDAFAANFSFFFSMGLDPEYSVLGRVARRVWAIVLRERYGAGERAQKLKYHVQTSGRSLHAREVAFNDIRTTLQALMAYYDRCNSLHTNAYDEAVTTPTEESVRRALAIQLIIQKELGLAANENPLQGSFVIEDLTDLVEEAVLSEFERIAERGGVLGAMESGYLRSKIQEESRVYEEAKQSGERAIIGVNTFLGDTEAEMARAELPVVRATEEEKRFQIRRLEEFQERQRPHTVDALARLKEVAASGGNTFEALMDVVRCASLGQITQALFEVGGAYRRMM